MWDVLRVARRPNRRVLSNFLSLVIVQFANYLTPLITLPYLFRVLGPSRYGLIEFARAINLYFVILTDYGFSLSATREVSIHRDDARKLSEVFSAVMLLKLLLVVLSFLALVAVVLGVPRLRADWAVYLLSFGHVIGMWLFPLWLSRGLERMKHIAVLNAGGRLLVIVLIFLVIRQESDYIYVPLLQSVGYILAGAAGLVVVLHSSPVRFRLPSTDSLIREFRNGWHIFISKMATTLYTTSSAVILGLLTNNTFVAYYAAGDKIVRAVQGLQEPLSQAVFPHVGRLASQSRQAALAFTASIAKVLGGVMLLMSGLLLVGAPYIARVLLGQQFEAGVPVIRILAFLPFITALSNVLSVQVMVNFGLKRLLARILTVAGILNIVMALLLVVPLKHVGAALASLSAEIFVTLAVFIALRRNNLDVFSTKR